MADTPGIRSRSRNVPISNVIPIGRRRRKVAQSSTATASGDATHHNASRRYLIPMRKDRSVQVDTQHRTMTGPPPLETPAAWVSTLYGWSVALRAAHRTDATIKTRVDHMRRIARVFPDGPGTVTVDQLLEFVGPQDWSRETRRSVYASCRAFWSWAVTAGRVGVNPAAALPVVRPSEPMPRPAPEHAIHYALRLSDDRTRMILRLGSEIGMRRGEIARIHARDVTDADTGAMLLVHGKGGRLREIPLHPGLAASLRDLCDGGYAFPGDIDGHLSAKHVGVLAGRALPDGVTLHMLRHRCATVIRKAGYDLLIIRRILGHASVATTQRYVEIPDDAMRAALAAAA